MTLRDVKLDDKYDLGQRRVFVTGFQALVRLCLMQKELRPPRRAQYGGLRHRLSRLAARRRRRQLLRAKAVSREERHPLHAGLNEDLAATAIWGAQQAEMRGEGKYDGVFSMWYGKGPGVDRSGDVLRHANLAGSSQHGGVLALMGDDHTAESSTTAHQSEYHFIDVMMPILSPAGVQEILDYGLYGWALSRYTGVWVGAQAMHETDRIHGLDRRQAGPHQHRHAGRFPHAAGRPQHPARRSRPGAGSAPAGLASATPCSPSCAPTGSTASSPRAAAIRRSASSPSASAISTCVRRSTISASTRSRATISASGSTRSACAWPLEPRELAEFAHGLDLIIVVEEKRSLIEVQVREELYGTANQPVCIGKKDENGQLAVPGQGRARSQ